MTKAVGAIGRVSVGASTMSGSLSVIAKSIEQTLLAFLQGDFLCRKCKHGCSGT